MEWYGKHLLPLHLLNRSEHEQLQGPLKLRNTDFWFKVLQV